MKMSFIFQAKCSKDVTHYEITKTTNTWQLSNKKGGLLYTTQALFKEVLEKEVPGNELFSLRT